ncbi:MAG: EAL domain-containing protein [Acidimicrobiia bacterium]
MDTTATEREQVGALPARLLDAVPDAIVVFDAQVRIIYANKAAIEFIGSGSMSDQDGAGPIDATTLVHPDDLAPALDELIAVFAVPGSTRVARLRIVNAEEVRPIEVFFVNMFDDPAVNGVVASFRDLRNEVALQHESEARQRLLERNEVLHREVLERQAIQARLLQIQQSISRRRPVNDVLVAIVEGAHELLGDEFIELHLDPLEDNDVPIVVQCVGGTSSLLDVHQCQPSLRALGDAARLADGLTVHDQIGETGTGMAVPIRDRHRTIGSLAVATCGGARSYRDVELEMLLNLAEHASVALMDARTVETVQAAFTDPLTGLPNRALLMDRLTQSVERCARLGTPLAVMFIDLGRFKGINDSYGHAVGDEVLACVGRRIAETLRVPDTAARLGGDEFVVVLESTDADGARRVAARISEVIRRPIEVSERTLYADATIGIVVAAEATHGTDAELILRHADIAMYRAKTTGRELVFFEPAMHSELLARQDLESEIRGAIANKALHAALQPIVDLASGRIVAVEALARWDHPTRGTVPADGFIAAAERIGAVVDLDRVVWAAACQAVGAIGADELGRRLSISLNLSVKHLAAPDLVPVLMGIVTGAGLTPERVTLEVTETELMQDVADSVEQLWTLRRLGMNLAIDDFGTGYSSLAYLQTLPVRTLKIDRSFVTGVDSSQTGQQLLRTMVSLAHGLDMFVVAEGIETEAEARAVADMGVGLGQGYWFAPPVRSRDLQAVLARTSCALGVDQTSATGLRTPNGPS